jgi:hypothetical protein
MTGPQWVKPTSGEYEKIIHSIEVADSSLRIETHSQSVLRGFHNFEQGMAGQ